MKKISALILAIMMLLALSVPAFAEGGIHHYTMVITSNSKDVYEGSEKVNVTTSGQVNAMLYKLLDTNQQNRSLFDTMTVEFDYADRKFTATKQTLIGKNGYTYVSSNPQAVFLDSPTKYHASGLGDSVITVTDTMGNAVDSFTVKVGGGDKTRVVNAVCSKCGKDMGTVPHLMVCGHFSCVDGALGHGYAECGIVGHFKCDGREHGVCTNCLQHLCEGEHGVGVCQHVHSWALRYDYTVIGWQWVEVPVYYCTTCGATSSAAPAGIFPTPAPFPAPGPIPGPIPGPVPPAPPKAESGTDS